MLQGHRRATAPAHACSAFTAEMEHVSRRSMSALSSSAST